MINNTPINQINVNGRYIRHNEVDKVNRRVEKVNKTSFNQTLSKSYDKQEQNKEKPIKQSSILKKTLLKNNGINSSIITTNNSTLNSNNELFNYDTLKLYIQNNCNDINILDLVDKALDNEDLLYIIINYVIKSNI